MANMEWADQNSVESGLIDKRHRAISMVGVIRFMSVWLNQRRPSMQGFDQERWLNFPFYASFSERWNPDCPKNSQEQNMPFCEFTNNLQVGHPQATK